MLFSWKSCIGQKYLVSKHDNYYNKLSHASKKTLEYQGGKMTKEEIELFENDLNFNLSLRVRNYDDIGKNIDTKIPSIESFKPLIEKYINYKDTL